MCLTKEALDPNPNTNNTDTNTYTHMHVHMHTHKPTLYSHIYNYIHCSTYIYIHKHKHTQRNRLKMLRNYAGTHADTCTQTYLPKLNLILLNDLPKIFSCQPHQQCIYDVIIISGIRSLSWIS